MAEEVVFRTPSEKNSIVVVTRDGRITYLREGQYGGYVIRREEDPRSVAAALACFRREVQKISWEEAVQRHQKAAELAAAVEKYGAAKPSIIRLIKYHYQPVELIPKKATDKYMVYDVRPVGNIITAEAMHVAWGRNFSARGRCYGVACNLEPIRLAVASVGLELYEETVGKRAEEYRAKIVVDASALEQLLRTAEEEAEEEDVEEEEEEAEEEDVEEEEEGAEEERREERGVDVSAVAAEVEKAAALEVELEEPALSAPAAAAQQQHERTAVRKQELVPIFLLRMRLPSKYLVQEVEYAERGRQEIRKFTDGRASALETLRRRIYEQISRVFCLVEEYGVWIAVSQDAVREAAELSGVVKEELKKLGFGEDVIRRYDVSAVKAYFETDDAKAILEAAVRRLSSDIEELEKRVMQAEAEVRKSAVRRLERDLEYRRALLESFKKALSSL